MKEKIQVIDRVVTFADKMNEVVRVVRAFLKGYEAFVAELKENK